MPSELRSWMRPGDLVLYQLDLLPWPAYLHLIQCYFEENAFRIKLIGAEVDSAQYLLVSQAGARQLLHCCSVPAAQRTNTLEKLRCHMSRCDIQTGILASPKDFGVTLLADARNTGVDLYSGNRLRAKIETMASERRRRVLDSIRPLGAQPDFGPTESPARRDAL